jgi:hypothetical protein
MQGVGRPRTSSVISVGRATEQQLIGGLCRPHSESGLGGVLSLLGIVHHVDIYFAGCVVVTIAYLTFCIRAYEGI